MAASRIDGLMPTSEKSKKQRESLKKQRQEKHRHNEAERPEDERLLTRSDLNKHAFKTICRGTMITYSAIIRFFCEFCEDVLHLPEGSGELYFEPNGRQPDTQMLRQFLFYLADGGQGRGPNGRITRRTAVCHAEAFFGAFAHCNRKLEREIHDQVLVWTRYDLVEQLDLNKNLAISKPVAHRVDVSLVLQMLFSPLGLRQVRSMRVLLHLCIFINLMIDCCGRIHEIVSTQRYPEQYLRYRDLRVYVFKIDGKMRLSAVLRLSGLKGMKDRPDHWKDIPLSLLPSHLCFEDSLRLILHAAIIDGHIEGVESWAALERLASRCDSNTGKLLPFRESSRDCPLIPAIDHTTGQVVVDHPIKPDHIPWQLERAGRLCGFEDIFKSHGLRRGAAFLLEASCSAEFRTWAMGHSPQSKTYMNSYKSQTATTDIQAIMHSVSERDVMPMGSMSLGRVENAPTTISPAGTERVMALPQIRDARQKCDAALDILTSKYRSVRAAQDDNSVEYTSYKEVRDPLRVLTYSLLRKEYEREYDDFVHSNQVLHMDGSSLESETPSSDLLDPNLVSDIDQVLAMDGSSLGNETLDFNLLDPDFLASDNDQSPDLVIDPLLLAQDHFDDAFDALKLSDTDRDVEETEDGDSSCWHPAEERDDHSAPAAATQETRTRLHGLYRFQAQQRRVEGSYYESQVFRSHHFDTLFDTVKSTPMSDLEISNLLLPFFKTMHPLERYGSLAPPPSTFVCPICGRDQGAKNIFEDHLCKCRRLAAQETAEGLRKQALDGKMVVPCDWVVRQDNGKRCGKVFTDYQKFTRHVLQHSWRNVRELCKYGACGTTNAVRLTTRDEWSDHLATAHGLTCYSSATTLQFFCSFCNTYIQLGIAGPSARTMHYRTHLNQAMDAVRKFGYNEVWSTVGGAELLLARHPWFCVWCFHDPNLEADKRIGVCNEGTASMYGVHRDHLLSHFLPLRDLGRSIPCPASAAAGTDFPLCSSTIMYTDEELEHHLQSEHGIHYAKGLSTAVAKPQRVRVRGKAKIAADAEMAAKNAGRDDDSDGELGPQKKVKAGVLEKKSVNIR